MIPLDWKSRARAPKGKILVQRDEVQKFYHGIIHISESYVDHVRTATGTIVDIHPSLFGVVEFVVGDYCALSPTGGRKILFGDVLTREEELWVFSPVSIKMILLDPEVSYEERGESFLRNAKREAARQPTVDERWTEGDRGGLR